MTARPAIAFLLLAGTAFGEAETASELDLVRAALARGPVEARREAARARRELAERARVAAPRTSLVARRESVGGDAVTTDVLGVGLELPLSRSTRPAREAAAREAQAATAEHRADLLEATCEVRALARDVKLRERATAALARHRDRLDAAWRESLRLAEAGEQAPFEAEVLGERLRQLASELALASADRSAAAAELEHLSGPGASEVALDAPTDAPALAELLARVSSEHPALVANAERRERSRALVTLAGRSEPATLDLLAGYRRDDVAGGPEEDGYEVEAGLTLPASSLRRSAVAAARAAEADAEALRQESERRILARVAAAWRRWTELDAIARVPTDASSLDLVEGALRRHRAGEGSLAEVLDVLDVAHARARARVELEHAWNAAWLDLQCASGFVTSPDYASLLKEHAP